MATNQKAHDPQDSVENALFMGELSLGAKLERIHGALPAAMFAYSTKLRDVFVPEVNAQEAAYYSYLPLEKMKLG